MSARISLLLLLALTACGGDDDGDDDDDVTADAAGPPDAEPSIDGAGGLADAAGPADAAPADAAPVVLSAPVTFATGFASLCGLGYDHAKVRVWVYPCDGADLHGFSVAGEAVGTVARPGEAADDVDVAVAPAAIVIGTNAVEEGALLFTNGESGVAEVHLPDTGESTPLVTAFGDSHVVGGAYHAGRETFFLVQDRVPGDNPNRVAEVDRVSGELVGSFSTLPAFDVNYGDLEVCQATGHLMLVSSAESTIAELTPAGELVAEYALPEGVTGVSGLGLAPDGQAWLGSMSGTVWRIEGLPCAAVE